MDGTLANFSMQLSGLLRALPQFCCEPIATCMDVTLAILFSETAFGLPSRFQPTRRWRDVLLWFLIQKVPFWDNFEIILGSKTVLWTHPRLLGPIWRPGGSQGQNSTIFPTPVLGPFLDKFSFWGENMLKICQKILCLCPVYFLNDFWWILRSLLEVKSGLKYSK